MNSMVLGEAIFIPSGSLWPEVPDGTKQRRRCSIDPLLEGYGEEWSLRDYRNRVLRSGKNSVCFDERSYNFSLSFIFFQNIRQMLLCYISKNDC